MYAQRVALACFLLSTTRFARSNKLSWQNKQKRRNEKLLRSKKKTRRRQRKAARPAGNGAAREAPVKAAKNPSTRPIRNAIWFRVMGADPPATRCRAASASSGL